MITRLTITLAILLITVINSFSQEMTIQNFTDDFTGVTTRQTSEAVFSHNELTRESFYFSITEVDSKITLDLKWYAINISIKKGARLILKLNNGDIVTLYNIGYEYSSVFGHEAKYQLTSNDIESLINKRVVKFRLHTAEKYIDEDINSSCAHNFRKALTLIKSN